MAIQPFKWGGWEVSGEIKRKCQENVRGMSYLHICKYVTAKAIVKFMRRVSLLCCNLVGGEETKRS